MTETTPKASSRPSRRSTRSGRSIVGLRLLARLRVPVAARTARRSRAAPAGRARARGTARRDGGRPRPRGRSSTRARRSASPSSAPVEASTTDERVRRGRAQRRRARRESPCRPRPSRAASARSSGTSGAPLERLGAERRRRRRSSTRRLEGGRGDVAVEDARVRVVEDRRLDAPAEQRLGLAHEVLVERVLARRRGRRARAPRRPARPHCWRRLATVPGKPDRDRAVEQADVDPELERVRRGDAEQLALDEAPLDLASLLRRVAGAVGGEPRGSRRVEPVGGEAVDQLGRLAALREADRAQAASDEPGQQLRRLAERARAQAELGVEERRVPERDRPLGARRRVVADDRPRRAPSSARAELAGVRDRRRGEQELRLGAVDPREPPQPPQDVRDVRAEDAAVDVRLVDDDVAEVVRGRRPSGRGAAGRRCGACPGS